jgi:AcrR family transcriptional regulator
MKNATTRDLLKLAARRLFAHRGFDSVSVHDIVLAAGQRNRGSLHYYFGTKCAHLMISSASTLSAPLRFTTKALTTSPRR